MPILTFHDDQLTQRCAACGAERDLAADALANRDDVPPGVLALPACPCGAREFLVRSPANEPPHPQPGSFGHRHRLLVDALAAALGRPPAAKASRRALADAVRAELGEEAATSHFSDGLRSEPVTADQHENATPTPTEEDPR